MDDVTQIILEKLDKMDSKLNDIVVQTTKTNGRVTSLETDVKSLKMKEHDPKNCPSNNKLLWKIFFIVLGSSIAIITIGITIAKALFKL